MEMCEDIRQTLGMEELYSLPKETIKRILGTAKENHSFRYTQMYGKARMEMKVGLTFACLNLKKLAKTKHEWGLKDKYKSIATRRGGKRAAVAIAHKILIIIYHMLKDNSHYEEKSAF